MAAYQEAVDLAALLQVRPRGLLSELVMLHGQTCWDILRFKRNKMKVEQEITAKSNVMCS
jgi:hypothetical protein